MLDYPFSKDQVPEPGQLQEVAEGVFWLRMPLPIALNHINLWILEESDGLTLVDTGICYDEAKQIWQQVLNSYFPNKGIKRVIVTHLHPDHIGLSGWLCGQFQSELWMTRMEYLSSRTMVADLGRDVPEDMLAFYRRAGYNQDQLDRYQENFGRYARLLAPLPDSYHRIQDGDQLEINGRSWQVVTGSGHSPEHACLWCPGLKVLISGDQVLPRITSNVSVWPIEPNSNPLKDWLDSCALLQDRLPNDVLVLPAHQEPFYGLHQRLAALIDSHQKALGDLLNLLKTPRSALDCFPVLFQREVTEGLLMFAIGEAVAHLNYLVAQGLVSRELETSSERYLYQILR